MASGDVFVEANFFFDLQKTTSTCTVQTANHSPSLHGTFKILPRNCPSNHAVCQITSKRERERVRKGASLGQSHAPCSFSFCKCFTLSRSQRVKIRPLANTGRANAHSAVQALTNVIGSCCMHGATVIPDDHVILVQPAVSYMDVVVGDQRVVYPVLQSLATTKLNQRL